MISSDFFLLVALMQKWKLPPGGGAGSGAPACRSLQRAGAAQAQIQGRGQTKPVPSRVFACVCVCVCFVCVCLVLYLGIYSCLCVVSVLFVCVGFWVISFLLREPSTGEADVFGGSIFETDPQCMSQALGPCQMIGFMLASL